MTTYLRLLAPAALAAALVLSAAPRDTAASGSPPLPGSGAVPWQRFTTLDLGGGLSLGVNAVNGNLLLNVDGLALPGVNGLDEAITLHYNSASRGVAGDVGYG